MVGRCRTRCRSRIRHPHGASVRHRDRGACKAEERTVITADLDYSRLLALTGAMEPSLILFRGGDWSDTDVIARIDQLIASIADADLDRGLFVVERNRIRRRRLPIRDQDRSLPSHLPGCSTSAIQSHM